MTTASHRYRQMPTGQHKGKPLFVIPQEYLVWAFHNLSGLTPGTKLDIAKMIDDNRGAGPLFEDAWRKEQSTGKSKADAYRENWQGASTSTAGGSHRTTAEEIQEKLRQARAKAEQQRKTQEEFQRRFFFDDDFADSARFQFGGARSSAGAWRTQTETKSQPPPPESEALKKCTVIYRELARKWHPDRNSGGHMGMQAINDFYAKLKEVFT